MASLSAADRLEIQELIANYYHAEDSAEIEPWVNSFTTDGGFKTRAGKSYFGHEQLRGFATDRSKRPDARLYVHWFTNLVVTTTPEGARAKYYSMTIGQTPDGFRIRGLALNTDDLRHENGRWLFKIRDSVSQPVSA